MPSNDQVRRDVRNLLSGASGSTAVVTSPDADVRALVNSELVRTMSSDDVEKQARARVLFIDHGYLDETVRTLSTASPVLQVEAARTLGLVGSRRATPSLVAALFDRSNAVQRAAAEALLAIRDPSVATAFLRSKFLGNGAVHDGIETTLKSEAAEGTAAASTNDLLEAPALPQNASITTSTRVAVETAELPSDQGAMAREITKLASHAKSEAAEAISQLTQLLADSEPPIQNSAVSVLYQFEPPFGPGLMNRLIDEGSPVLREQLGRALVSSGLANKALDDLGKGSREEARDALHLLQLLIKTRQFEPLVTAITEHQNVDVRRAVIKLLNLAGQAKIANEAAQRRLALVTQ